MKERLGIRKEILLVMGLFALVLPSCSVPSPEQDLQVPLSQPLAYTENVLRVAVVGGASHEDLHQQVSEWATLFGPGPSYSRLLRFEVGSGVDLPSMKVICDLCVEFHVRDSLVYEFDLHPNARWQGTDDFASRRVTAADVVFSLERLRTNGFPHERLLDTVDTITAVNSNTVRLDLHEPDSELLQKLASPYAVIIPPDHSNFFVTRIGAIVGSGPWRYSKGMSGQVDLIRWPEYFRVYQSAVDRIVFLPVSDLDLASSLLRAGEVDIARVTEDQWGILLEEGFSSTVVERQGTGVMFGLNSRRTPLDDRDIRRAILFAMNPRSVIDEVWNGTGRFGLGAPVVDPSWRLSTAEMGQFVHNLEASADLLASTKMVNRPLKLTVANFGPQYLAVGELFGAQLLNAGFDITVEKVTRAQYLKNVWNDRDFDLFIGPAPPTVNTNDFLLSLFHSRGQWNVTGWHSDQLDDMLESQSREGPPDRRGDLVRSIERHVMDEALMFMPAVRHERWAYSESVENINPNMAAGGGEFWQFVQLR